MEITGKIIAVLEEKSGIAKSGNAWRTQEYVLEIPGNYPKRVCFEVFGANIDTFAIINGEDLTASIDIDARQWQDRWFNSIRAWKVVRATAAAPEPVQAEAPIQGENSNGPLPF